jgi:hypothetical protein
MREHEVEQGREPLNDWQRSTVLDTNPEAGDRIEELELHTREELGDYVHDLAQEVPPNEELTRRELYRWELVEPEHYHGWAKKELIRRIVTMEEHDDIRIDGDRVPYREPPPPSPSQMKAEAEERSAPRTYNRVHPRGQAGDYE